jgi:hypothetical protein
MADKNIMPRRCCALADGGEALNDTEREAIILMPRAAEFRLEIVIDLPADVVELLGDVAGMVDEDVVGEPLVECHVPAEITEPIAYAMYWDAMNRSRSVPYVQRFTIPDYAKSEY